MTEEIWKPVVGHEGYEVSNLGRVRSVGRWISFQRSDGRNGRRWFNGKLLTPVKKSNGYLAVSFGRLDQTAIHVAVLAAFIGHPQERQQCLHDDGDKINNRLDNLRWGTGAENSEDARRHGILRVGEKNNKAKLTAVAVQEIRTRFGRETGKQICADYGVAPSTIIRAAAGRTWRHVP